MKVLERRYYFDSDG